MNRYEVLERVGDGSFGEVWRARSLKTREIVAVKKIKALFPTWEECLQLRELRSLRVLRHENIVLLKEVIRDKEELYFVFEYMQTSLCRVMRHFKCQDGSNALSARIEACSVSDASGSSWPSPPSHPWFSEAQVRSIMYQLFSGLAHMHKHGYFHRDIKPENLLCHNETLKIADLGQAREIRSRPPFTDYVATRWYRAPELLLRSTTYNSPIDMWACGCILVELLICTPLFPGTSEADQFYRICKVLGRPTKETWPEGASMASQLQLRLPKCAPAPWGRLLPVGTPPAAIQLVQDLLQYDPSRRLTAAQALQHPFFDQPVARPPLTIPPLALSGGEVPVVPLANEHKASAGYSSDCSKKAEEVPAVESSALLAGGGGLSTRREHHEWTAREWQQPSTRQKEASFSLHQKPRIGSDGTADAKAGVACQHGSSISRLPIKKSSSYNTLLGADTPDKRSLYTYRNGASDDNYGDKSIGEAISDDALLQDLLDEILG